MIWAIMVLSLVATVDTTTIVVALVSVILGGGLTGGLIPIFKYRQEKDSAIAIGAESAVQSLTAALNAADLRWDRCVKENESLRAIIEEFRVKLDDAHDKFNAAQDTIRGLVADLQETKTKLNRLLKEQP